MSGSGGANQRAIAAIENAALDQRVNMGCRHLHRSLVVGLFLKVAAEALRQVGMTTRPGIDRLMKPLVACNTHSLQELRQSARLRFCKVVECDFLTDIEGRDAYILHQFAGIGGTSEGNADRPLIVVALNVEVAQRHEEGIREGKPGAIFRLCHTLHLVEQQSEERRLTTPVQRLLKQVVAQVDLIG